MHIISRRPFSDAAKKFPNQKRAIAELYKMLKQGQFKSPDEMRLLFPTLDNFKYKEKWWVLDVAGNHLRLIIFIQFACSRIYVKNIITHAQYSKLTKRYAKGEL